MSKFQMKSDNNAIKIKSDYLEEAMKHWDEYGKLLKLSNQLISTMLISRGTKSINHTEVAASY
jgi:hypothetical protein